MKLLFIILFISCFAKQNAALGQAGLIQGANDPSKADIKALNSDSRLTHIVLTPKDKLMEYYLVGTKEGEVNFNNLKVFSNQMNPIPDQPVEHKQNSPQAKSSTVVKHKAVPVVVSLRHIRSHVKSQVVRQVKIVTLTNRLKDKQPSLASGYSKKTSGHSDMAYLLIFLLFLFIAAYAYRISSKMRNNQTARIFP